MEVDIIYYLAFGSGAYSYLMIILMVTMIMIMMMMCVWYTLAINSRRMIGLLNILGRGSSEHLIRFLTVPSLLLPGLSYATGFYILLV